MAKLALITAKTYTESVNNIGDIVGVFDDDHIFTDKEKLLFDIYSVSESKETIYAKIPGVKMLTRAKTIDWTDQDPEQKEVWEDNTGVLRDLVTRPKYPLCIDNGEVKETYSRIIENTTNIVTLETEAVKEIK